jgi:hypothetical protein
VTNYGWTTARRRAARLSIENRKTRRERKDHDVTAPYSAAQVESHTSNAEKARDCVPQVPALSIVRAAGASQVREVTGTNPIRLVERQGLEPSTPAM